MNKFVTILMSAFLTAAMLIPGTGTAATDSREFSVKPTMNDGRKWRIAYYEGGEYIDYQQVLTETVKGLMRLGWLKPTAIPPQGGEQTADLWAWLGRNVESDYIEFVPDAHYSSHWDDKVREDTVETIIRRLNEQGDIDLMIAMGTWAGKDLANNRHSTPTLVLSASDPLSAGIIKSVEDSGYDHVHATVDPQRFRRQVQVFHEIVGFRTLGVAYEDSVNGRSYAAIDAINDLKKERGFKVVPCFTKSDIRDTREAEKSVVDCFSRLVSQVDAIYVTQQGGVNSRSIPQLVRVANDNKVPTFSQSGSEEVRYGFLASLSQAGFRYVGEFHAETIAKVFNGAKPNQLDQHFEEPPKIALNLKTAEIIGFNPPVVLLGAADEIFTDIASPE